MERKKEKVARFFDEISSEYRDAYGERCQPSMRTHILQSRREIVYDLLQGQKGRVLDIGCGPGVFVQKLLVQGWEVWGVDISPTMIKEVVGELRGKEGTVRGYFLVGDIEALPLPDCFFDAVLCIGVLEYLDGAKSALKEIARVLKPGGTFILSIPNGVSPLNLLDRGSLLLARSILRAIEGSIQVWNKGYRLPIQRRSLKGEFPGHLCYPAGRVARGLAHYGLSEKNRVFHTYQSALISTFAPSVSLALNRCLDKNLPGNLRWLGVDCVLKGTKERLKR